MIIHYSKNDSQYYKILLSGDGYNYCWNYKKDIGIFSTFYILTLIKRHKTIIKQFNEEICPSEMKK